MAFLSLNGWLVLALLGVIFTLSYFAPRLFQLPLLDRANHDHRHLIPGTPRSYRRTR